MEDAFFWNQLIATLPQPHFLQTWEWGQVKTQGSWQPLYAVWSETDFRVSDQLSHLQPFDTATPLRASSSTLRYGYATQGKPFNPQAAALILKKTSVGGLCVLYCPKGPNLDWNDAPLRKRVLDDLEGFARQQGAIFLKLDPDVVLGTGVPGAENDRPEPGGEAVRADLSRRGWRFSADQIQFRNTVVLDVSASEEEMLARMKQKTRYNARLASKKGVTVRVGTEADFALLYKMYAETSVRDGFIIRDENYYQTVWQMFAQPSTVHGQPSAEPLIAEVEGQPVAAVFVFAFAGRAYYVYGMSREEHRDRMPNYLLQWEAMRWARARGCSAYDLWGAPEQFDESDAMWGVFRFKEGLGGQVVRTLGAWDFTPNPLWYALYTQIMPKALDVLRWFGRAKTRRTHEGATHLAG